MEEYLESLRLCVDWCMARSVRVEEIGVEATWKIAPPHSQIGDQ